MKKLYSLCLFITVISFAQSPGDIIITEIMKNPAAVSDANGEYFEVYNTTGSPINMDGWTVTDYGTQIYTISSLTVPAGSYAVFGRNADTNVNGSVVLDYVPADPTGVDNFGLNNADDEIVLTSGSTVIDEVAYDDGIIFPDPNGASMELSLAHYNSTDNDNGANWGVATSAYGDGDKGTPGTTNDFTLSVGQFDAVNFSLYPNPTSTGYVTIKSDLYTVVEITLFNLLGKQMLRQTLNNGEDLNVLGLSSGVYVIKVFGNGNGGLATKKLVIK